ncbi:MAG: glucose-6-phosphate dehydrogenase [Armatimonadia bacterium]
MSQASDGPRPAEPHVFVVMGGSGDLMRHKLLPALWRLAEAGYMARPSQLLAAGRRAQFDDAGYRQWAADALREAGLEADRFVNWCGECAHYHSVGEETAEDFRGLARRLEELEKEHGLPGNRVFYLAIPPTSLHRVVEGLGQAGLHQSAGSTRLVIEKPFGSDLNSARELDAAIKRYYEEEQIYRIDHYLGKEAVQNLLVFRFANPIFEALWRREQVSSVQITVAETAGAEGRAGYYDGVGVVRDMMQNHLTQLLALTAMEIPPAFEADAIRDEKAKVLRSVKQISPRNVVLGQYSAGEINGEPVKGYVEAEEIPNDSSTPTFAALELQIDNWRWQGVPFFLRTGKRLAASARQIVVNFRCPVLALFERFEDAPVHANSLVINIEPDEGFELLFDVKAPGDMLKLQPQVFRFRYDSAFERLPEAYEALLLDILHGDQTLFVRIDEVLEAWRLFTPLLGEELKRYPYVAGTWGPKEAERVAAPTGAACFL